MNEYIVKGKVIKALSPTEIIILVDETKDVRKVIIETETEMSFYKKTDKEIIDKSIIIKGKLIGDKIKIADNHDGFEIADEVNIIDIKDKDKKGKEDEDSEIFIT